MDTYDQKFSHPGSPENCTFPLPSYHMKKAVLIFPSTISMAEFIMAQRITKAESNSIEKCLTAVMTDKQIEIARKQFGAKLKASSVVRA